MVSIPCRLSSTVWQMSQLAWYASARFNVPRLPQHTPEHHLPGWVALLHEIQDIVHAGTLKLRKNIRALKASTNHLIVWLYAPNEASTLKNDHRIEHRDDRHQ